MMELKIEIKVPDLAAAICKLADAVVPDAPVTSGEPAPTPVATPAVPAAATIAPTPVPTVAPTAPVPTEQIAAPVAQTPAPAVPVTAPTYTLDQIARAGASLVDAGKMDQLLALLAKHGVAAITQLQPDQFGAFATELRSLGAQI